MTKASCSVAQTCEVTPFSLVLDQIVFQVESALLQEAVEFHARSKTEDSAQLPRRQRASRVFRQSKSFERETFEVPSVGAKPLSDFIWDGDGDVHGSMPPRRSE